VGLIRNFQTVSEGAFSEVAPGVHSEFISSC
jgi:hypothetical protein